MKDERKKLRWLAAAVCAVCAVVVALNVALGREGPPPPQRPDGPSPAPSAPVRPGPSVTPGGPSAQPAPEPAPPAPTAPAAEPTFDVPKAGPGATLVFIFDDAGQSVDFVRRYTSLPFPVAVSVLPGLPRTKECAALVRRSGRELMLHQPMQSENLSLYPGPGSIQPNMTTQEISALVSANIDELGGGVRGVNNHEGSLITANAVKMGAVLETCRRRGVYFLDSKTTAGSAAAAVSLEMDIPILERNAPYIDNEINRGKMLARIMECLAYANRHGTAVIIGHVDKSADILPGLLLELHPHLVRAGYRFAVPSSLVERSAD